jgi:hypothetical protein
MIENRALVLDLLAWVAEQPRAYADAMEAWRTSCPRFPIWEDCTDLGFIRLAHTGGAGPVVEVTAAGRAFLESARGDRSRPRAGR